MKILPFSLSLLLASAITMLAGGLTFADDGPMVRKDVSGTPEQETEHAAIRMLPVYVPTQNTAGDLIPIDYYNADGVLVETREYARPLITHYTDGYVEFIEEEGYGGFPGHGRRDAYGAVSLDDGATWKRTNLSDSGDRYSIKIKVGKKKVPYYGDVLRTYTASDGNKVLVTWVSKYCGSGSPAYAMTTGDGSEQDLLADHLAGTGTIVDANDCTDGDPMTPCTYLEDVFGVAGSQGIQSARDLEEDGYPLVGDYPYSCAWAARGVMLPPDDSGVSRFVWFKAERLSSGVRDANRPETVCVKGAGCVVTWQEDPDGIRPGHGDGPGEGWSGAVAHHQTDTWYTYIDWDDFDLVSEDGTYGNFNVDDPATVLAGKSLQTWVEDNPTGSPKIAVPMSIPLRLTDNAMCTGDDLDATDFTSKAYCGIDFDDSGTVDFCVSTVPVSIETPEGPTQEIEMCVTEDGRLLRGNTASTRARLGLHGYSTACTYDPTSPETCPINSAWFYMAYEENKGLGDEGEDEITAEDLIDKVDMGKNVWYHTFDMFHPELVSQGLMLNQPAVYQTDFANPEGFLTQETSLGYNFYTIDPDPIYETQAGLDTTLYQTEIARRPSKISQDWYDAGPSGLVGFQLWKQGIIRRGGPADIMARRFVIPTGDTTTITTYTFCTTYNEVCSTSFELCTTGTCVANIRNPDYKLTGQCKKEDKPSTCYKYYYVDENGDTIYTDDPENCTAPSCNDIASGFCPAPGDLAENQTCEEFTDCQEPVEGFCPVNLDPSHQSCGTSESCIAVETCPDEPYEEWQECKSHTTTVTGGFDASVDNPYDYANMECATWAFTDGSNPRYVKGFCASPAINLSANTILTSESCGDAEGCLDAFPFNEYFDDMDMEDSDPISKILTWQQSGPGFGETIDDTALTNLDDMSWENPYDMAKGHRGYLAGDMVMLMYGWTNNWKALTDANDIINLYVRRSFDGGMTWSTLPVSFEHTNDISYHGDGTTTCEWMGLTGTETEYPVCTAYAAGDFEQARNVSQLLGHKVTVLDPRFSPTTRSITPTSVSTLSLPGGFFAPEYLDDTRDPSRFFMVYETGHTSAYDAGEAPPLDLFYSRAVDWGDDYLVWQDVATTDCLPSADTDAHFDIQGTGFCNEFDWIEGSQFAESGEASVTASPGGQFFYATWNQWDFDRDGYLTGADAWFRRMLFLDDYVPGETTE